MDVIVNPTGSCGTAWSLDDRLGRHLGTIHKSANASSFVIEPEPASQLRGVALLHASLDEAMSAIAQKMAGACELNSQDWD
ncbi:hypothetical protein [Methylobacterium oxalidis]|uniref:Uncharacterized protein n=1 Tax=Methylobacterium oxalidis TaxID=944322 RepID=A0A512J9K2_9HYPH|nr:hypothetical protein [Methylobacterium oxalidis]GEP06627.1 hypothetical protein MOX02_46650 [Methylobacterium oxalidis]GJE35393.1 hypothetical protein LDDCCGHA_5611 [Methylobacterium oxalidis]GLS66241.1 hypothetical protein GCM10007888_46230 [Methylobacterium oxalidis]